MSQSEAFEWDVLSQPLTGIVYKIILFGVWMTISILWFLERTGKISNTYKHVPRRVVAKQNQTKKKKVEHASVSHQGRKMLSKDVATAMTYKRECLPVLWLQPNFFFSPSYLLTYIYIYIYCKSLSLSASIVLWSCKRVQKKKQTNKSALFTKREVISLRY